MSEYWTVWGERICEKHKTLKAAISHALRCERDGGAPHEIFEVEKKLRPPVAKARKRSPPGDPNPW